ncbi:unnamed protein product [Paramecium primaurelia]|uniref:Uncharacterized protein n=1 Tax=Paramecium primaurelia TaxID=5886 RepID=A0A8S1L2D3_PARPR|nr:unnamed protein product [Paramecium primaurelia]
MQTQPQTVGVITYYSDQYEPQCPYCQSGEHSIQSDSSSFQQTHLVSEQATRGKVVYVSPERIVSRKIIESNTLSPSIQQLMTPSIISTATPQIINSQYPLTQVSPVLNQIQNISKQQSPILIHQQYVVPQQSFIQQQIPIIQQSTQDYKLNIELQQSQLIQQDIQLKQKELAEKLQNQTEEIQQSNLAYRQLQQALQEKKEEYEQLKKAYAYQTQYSPTSQVPQSLQEIYNKSQIKEKKVVLTKEELELYWKHRVFELEQYLYELWGKIAKMQSQNEEAKKDDSVKIEILQREVCQLEHIVRLKSNSVVILKNKLNNLMYQYDPASEITKQYDQQLQSLRQQVMNLNSLYLQVQEEIQGIEQQNQKSKLEMNDYESIPINQESFQN